VAIQVGRDVLGERFLKVFQRVPETGTVSFAARVVPRHIDDLAAESVHASPDASFLKYFRTPIFEEESRRHTLANVLFPFVPIQGWDEEHSFLVEELRNAPQVLRLIGGPRKLKLRFEQLADVLREKVDPFEHDDSSWRFKVPQAELWMSFEERAAPGCRGPGKKTAERVRRAVELARNGCRNSEIAKALGVCPATITRWADRYPEFARECRTRDLQRVCS
jgi:hypothetical protein